MMMTVTQILLGGEVRHLLEQDTSRNNDRRCASLSQILACYEEEYREYQKHLKQSKVSDFLACRNAPQSKPELVPADDNQEIGPSSSRPDSQPSTSTTTPGPASAALMDVAADFEGFEDLLDSLVTRRGDQ